MNHEEQLWLERGIHGLLCGGPDDRERCKLLLRIARDREAGRIVEEMAACQRAVREAFGQDDMEDVMARSLKRMRAASVAEAASPPAGGTGGNWGRRVAVVVASAAMVIGAVLWHAWWHGGSGAGTPSPGVAAATLSAAEVDRYRQMFESVSEVFEGKASWVALTDGASDMGLRGLAVDRSDVLMLRLVLSRDGKVVSNADLVMVPGQDAVVTAPLGDGRTVRYHVAAAADAGPLSILAKVTASAEGGRTLGTLAANVTPDGSRGHSAGRVATGSGGYELAVASARTHRKEPLQ